jgi:CRISPR-associated protein Csd2
MSTEAHLDPTVRHDAILLFDVTDGNPNGDPDSGNQPRIDIETSQGLVSDVALKRKIRDTIPLVREGDPRFGIFVEAGHALNDRIKGALEANADTKKSPDAARAWMCEHYFDIRMFGAVLSTGAKEKGSKSAGVGQVYGPTQVTFARSIDPIAPFQHTITRVTQTRSEDIAKGESTEIGRKWTVPYGLYQAQLHYSAAKAEKTGVTGDDLAALWRAVTYMFEHSRSAARGEMKLCGLFVFSHTSKLGDTPAHALTARVKAALADESKTPRSHADYRLSVERDGLSPQVTLTELVNIWA